MIPGWMWMQGRRAAWRRVLGVAVLALLAAPWVRADEPTGPDPRAGNDDVVLARLAAVNEAVTVKDFNAYVTGRADLQAVANSYWGAEAALKEMVMTRALVLEGQRRAIRNERGDTQRFDDVYGLTVYQKLVPACTAPADAAAARQYFDEHPEAFRLPASERIKRIVVPADQPVEGKPPADWLAAQAQAIARGERTFDAVVQQASALYKMETQGDVGWIRLDADLPLMRALASAKAGELVGPVREGDHAYLFQIMAKHEARQMTWEEAEQSVPSRAITYCREQNLKQLQERLFRDYQVTLDTAALKDQFRVRVDSGAGHAHDHHDHPAGVDGAGKPASVD